MASSTNDVKPLSPHRHADVNQSLISPKPKQTVEDSTAGWSPKDIIRQAGLLAKAFFWDVLLPTGNIMLGWNIVMLLLLTYLATVLPYAVAFKIDFSDLGNPLSILDLTINLIFMCDIWMNFHTAVLGHDGRLISDRHGIASRYLKGWFWFDLLSSFPFEQVLVFHNSLPSLVMLLKVVRVARIVRMIKLLRLLRIARLTRLPQVMLRLESLIGRVPLQLMGLFGSAFLLLHWAACIWHYLSWAQDNANNWVYHNGLEQADNFERYVTSLYWSVATIAAVGYGDVVGHSVLEKIVAMIAMLTGATVFGYFMGSMTVMVSALNASSARMATKRQAVDDFLRHRRVPKALADKVRAYYSYVVEREVAANEADIITGLSSSLRTQVVLHLYAEALEKVVLHLYAEALEKVVLHLYAEALEKVPFFRGQHPQFITSVVTFLKLEYYAPGDIVVRQGDMGSEMYFVGEGALEVRLYEDERGSPIARAAYKRKGTNGAQQAAPADKPSRSGGVGACSNGGTPLSVDESLLHEFTLFRGEKKAREKYTYVDELGDRPYKRINLLRPGEYFGELSCLLGEARNATVVASTYCELYSLSRADLEEVLQQWPELAEEFEAMVQTAADHKAAQAPTSLHGTHSSPLGTAGGPLTKWNVFKAAYSQSLYLFPYGLDRNGSLAAPAAAAAVADDDQFVQYSDGDWSVASQHQDSQDRQF
ncbi:hypothetical protein OEZ86_010005 [Tetradesmus obliquus]|uniref:Cyclic nucleotide-binding domain-containing protein n=1 Tax=Tetradesmus obliquus TaxID=3088 RepID=A0ABY8UP95_TETOB|nr:hypothetical protein OEZ85_001439 [Tetradesmus obliquus]WIA43554.1 hypothetical protein OEZ86_010005 [Tetradesmus obliquus]